MNDKWEILHGDALKLLGGFAPGAFDAVITDPPYASGGRTQAEKKEVASAWLELAISCAKVPVKYEADEIKRRQKEEKTQRETEPVMA